LRSQFVISSFAICLIDKKFLPEQYLKDVGAAILTCSVQAISGNKGFCKTINLYDYWNSLAITDN
jgi:hypothetical protein